MFLAGNLSGMGPVRRVMGARASYAAVDAGTDAANFSTVRTLPAATPVSTPVATITTDAGVQRVVTGPVKAYTATATVTPSAPTVTPSAPTVTPSVPNQPAPVVPSIVPAAAQSNPPRAASGGAAGVASSGASLATPSAEDVLTAAIQAVTPGASVAFAADGSPIINDPAAASVSAPESGSPLPSWAWLALAAGLFFVLRK